MTADEAWNLANSWISAWNLHDLDLIMTHYDEVIESVSPIAVRLGRSPDGRVIGKTNLRTYFERGLELHPKLHFHLQNVLWGVNSVVLSYTNEHGIQAAEFMELSSTGKVSRVVANYSAP